MSDPRLTGILVRIQTPEDPVVALKAAAAPLRDLGLGGLEPLFEVPPAGDGERLGAAPEAPAAWFRAPVEDGAGESPWEVVHRAAEGLSAAAAGGEIYLEPDLETPFVSAQPRQDLAAAGAKGAVDPPDASLPSVGRFAWFLDDDFSELRRAREAAGGGEGVRIAHLDTGWDPDHQARPPRVAEDLQRSFVDGEAPGSARDPGHDRLGPLDQPGHGTGTLGLLAGGHVDPLGEGDSLGGAPGAEIVPVRIAESVVLIRTGALARALDYAAAGGPDGSRLVDVVSLSMGGLASRAWADAINKAYEAGVCVVAAAGNNFSAGIGGLPTRLIVFPARFRRVIAACGVMADRRPYYGLPFGKMQGNWGPASKMATAIAAFTPNLPWAELGAPAIVDLDGAGTSCSTPQIAAAAALWLARHREAVARYPHGWQRVEAVRHALFTSAEKTADGGRSDKLGNGVLRAARALQVAPLPALAQTPRDRATFAFLRLFLGLGTGLAAAPGRIEMLALEATQLAQRAGRPGESNVFDEIVPDPDLPAGAIPSDSVRRFVEALIRHPLASKALQEQLAAGHDAIYPATRRPSPRRKKAERAAPLPTPAPAPAALTPAALPTAARTTLGPPYAVAPSHRRLRGFAIDPSLAQRLETAPVSTVTFKVPWEELEPGPVGEYLEVIDFDPASRCFFEPVDLDEPRLLAQDGLAPSEGTPQFHQQMVYAVASLTIHNFERALGRKAFWSPGPPPEGAHRKNDSHFVRRLRIHPHALRQANAYYSPSKKALLFGYYPATPDDPGGHMPGGMVFTCLSHDVIAHETTHALLDGMHRRLIIPSNPDVLAFHEAFADIVALFQHFTLPEIVRHQMAQTRGDIRSQWNVLGELAGEFGRTTGGRNALRSAIGSHDAEGIWQPHQPSAAEYQTTFEPHLRGAILVAAVFDAFLAIYETRVADLLRLATGGSGILQAGAIPPDLVRRLSDEASKAAGHVLTMCVRALDYCPPVDLTFGEYLRAIITADLDLVRDDDKGYRVAFIEAFRRRGIYPGGLRTLSVDSLCWNRPQNDQVQPSAQLLGGLDLVRDALRHRDGDGSREQAFHFTRTLRRDLHDWLAEHLANGAGPHDARFLGLDPKRRFEVHSLRVANRVGPDGDLLRQIIVDVLQSIDVPVDPADRGGRKTTVEGGCTLVADLERLEIDYCIRKSAISPSRLRRQREYVTRFGLGSLHDTYFGAPGGREPIAALHARS